MDLRSHSTLPCFSGATELFYKPFSLFSSLWGRHIPMQECSINKKEFRTRQRGRGRGSLPIPHIPRLSPTGEKSCNRYRNMQRWSNLEGQDLQWGSLNACRNQRQEKASGCASWIHSWSDDILGPEDTKAQMGQTISPAVASSAWNPGAWPPNSSRPMRPHSYAPQHPRAPFT